MTRKILCPTCYDQLFARATDLTEKKKIVRGKATIHFYCDHCSTHITPGDDCIAVSVWVEGQGIPYYPWESEYLERTIT